MSNALQQTIEALAKEKGIEPDVIITAIEDAVLTASRKYYKTNENLRTKFNRDTGQVELFAVRQIMQEVTNPETEISLDEARRLYGDEAEVDMEIEFPKATDVLGRIAAQTAKQVIFQKVREAERENIYAEYSQRLGEVVTGTVKRFENGDLIVETGRIEALLARRDQSRAENYTAGDRVRAVIKGVNRSTKGPQIILSRTDPALLIKLFEQEVPEIYDGTVVIRGAVREAGDRAKVAVFSRERDVDPVGACVGMKGTRVQSIIRELRGEKIDIVEWSDDSITFVTNAISPARVQRVSIVGEAGKSGGNCRGGHAAVARHREEGPECPAGSEAHGVADRHQERRGKAARSGSPIRGPRNGSRRSRRGRAPGGAHSERGDAPEAGRCWARLGRAHRGYGRRGVEPNLGHRSRHCREYPCGVRSTQRGRRSRERWPSGVRSTYRGRRSRERRPTAGEAA